MTNNIIPFFALENDENLKVIQKKKKEKWQNGP